jgi:hypothetical protein
MINSVEQYLADLKKAMTGSDRATVQDALSDAEEYLRNALSAAVTTGRAPSPAEALQPIIEKYGTPAEVAAAYKQIESRTPPSFTSPAPRLVEKAAEPAVPPGPPDTRSFLGRLFGIYAEPRAWASLLYLLFSFVTGIIYFTWAITGLSLSLGLLVLIVGLPIAALFLLSVRGVALIEGRLVEALLGVRMPRRPLFSRKDIGWWQKFKGMLASGRTWTALCYMILQMPLGIIYFSIFVTLISVSAWLIGRPLFEYALGLPAFWLDGPFFTYVWAMPFEVIGGILLLTGTLHLMKYIGRFHAGFARMMLVRE